MAGGKLLRKLFVFTTPSEKSIRTTSMRSSNNSHDLTLEQITTVMDLFTVYYEPGLLPVT